MKMVEPPMGYLYYYTSILSNEIKLFNDLLETFRENNSFDRIFYISESDVITRIGYRVLLSEDELLIMKLTLSQGTKFTITDGIY